MANTLNINKSGTYEGLGTFNYTVTSDVAGPITVQAQSNIPHDPGSTLNSAQTSPFASGLQMVISKNGSAVATIGGTAKNPTQSQPAIGTKKTIQCVAGDVLAVVLSSSAAADAVKNAVKTTISLWQGY